MYNDIYGELPKGCEICLRGGKLVLFITGLCEGKCYYCPLSNNRKGKDVIYADEILVKKELEVLLEAKAINAEGTGITGGDPLLKLNRTLKYIKLLKDYFGKNHHIHLYTNGMYASIDNLKELKNKGLDELRFHSFKIIKGIENAINIGISTGVEIPAIPNNEEEIKKLILLLEKIKVDFLNINQLEFTPTNALQLKERGFEYDKSIKESEELALRIIEWAKNQGIELNIHYCSIIKKDRFQFKMRILRRRENIIRAYEEKIEEGLIGKFMIECNNANELRRKLLKELNIPPIMIGISNDGKYLEISRKYLEKILERIPNYRLIYVKELPTVNREKIAEINL